MRGGGRQRRGSERSDRKVAVRVSGVKGSYARCSVQNIWQWMIFEGSFFVEAQWSCEYELGDWSRWCSANPLPLT